MIRFRDDGGDDDPGEQDDALEHGGEAGIDDTYAATCPYCGEECELLVDLAGGSRQSYVEDCAVCCQPWQVRVTIDADGAVTLELEALDE